jgi:hypothetical protein
MKNYRPGATGALLDEYERVLSELKAVMEGISGAVLVAVADPLTTIEKMRRSTPHFSDP